LLRADKQSKLYMFFRRCDPLSDRGRRAMGHGLSENPMFRLSLFGFACLALAACALVGIPIKKVQDARSEPNANPDPDRLPDLLTRIAARGYHAKFSVN